MRQKKSASILKKFLLFNLGVFSILGLLTIVYLKAIQPNLVKKRAADHYIIINNTVDHLQRLKINFNAKDIKTFLLSTRFLFQSLDRVQFYSMNGDLIGDTNILDLDQSVFDLIDIAGMTRQSLDRYPHEFSGGQRQRISIARALATRPRLLICDEPTSALDVSIQAQILNLLKDIQDELHLTMLFISHDLPVIRQMCNRIIVLKNGIVCETNEAETLFNNPKHQYTKELINLMPKIESII